MRSEVQDQSTKKKNSALTFQHRQSQLYAQHCVRAIGLKTAIKIGLRLFSRQTITCSHATSSQSGSLAIRPVYFRWPPKILRNDGRKISTLKKITNLVPQQPKNIFYFISQEEKKAET